ncbi:hypothetical protein ACFC1R_38395 [Kitasatospora sp. NPDC056138]|uniref:hypothetical protein n=1 Tax=Kitasatospora sp. NPDC056138 TaxID=3345724 RepID=UPI0035D5F4E9
MTRGVTAHQIAALPDSAHKPRPPAPDGGTDAAQVAAAAGIPVALLARHTDRATVTAATGGPGPDGQVRYIHTTAAYANGDRVEVHVPGRTAEELVAKALGGTTRPGLLGTPDRPVHAEERWTDGWTARAAHYRGWLIVAVTRDPDDQAPVPALHIVWDSGEHRGRPGRCAGPA